jgi:hypothetical protein
MHRSDRSSRPRYWRRPATSGQTWPAPSMMGVAAARGIESVDAGFPPVAVTRHGHQSRDCNVPCLIAQGGDRAATGQSRHLLFDRRRLSCPAIIAPPILPGWCKVVEVSGNRKKRAFGLWQGRTPVLAHCGGPYWRCAGTAEPRLRVCADQARFAHPAIGSGGYLSSAGFSR